jgi:hypothetical protein
MKRLLLWGFIISLFVTPCYGADVKVSALPAGTVASTWLVVCEAGTAPTLSTCTVSSLLALKVGTVTDGKVCLGDSGGKIQCSTDAYQTVITRPVTGPASPTANNLVKYTGTGQATDNTAVILGTMTDGKWCSYATSGTALSCNQTAPQAALTYPVTGVASPTAGYMTKWGVSGNAIVDGPKIGTFTDTKWCVFTTAGGLECTTNAPAGAGDFKADGTVPMTAAIVPNAANTIALGSATAEWADLYLGDGAIIYGQNDQSNTFTSSASGWTANRNLTATNFIPTNQADAAGEIGYADNVYSLFANSEDFSLTAGTNLWTFNSTTGATFKFTPALEVTGLITASGGISGAHNGTVGATTPAAGKFTTLEASTSLSVTASLTAGGYIRLLEGSSNGADYSMITGAADAGTYPSFTFSGSQGAEDLVLTASNNLWTFSSTTAATVAFTPSVALNGGASVGGTLALGANNITSTGSLGATGAGKLTKVWAVDAETTNIPTVGGTGILTSLTAPQFTTIELGAASDTTLERVSAGVVSIEGKKVVTQAEVDGSAHLTLTAAQVSNTVIYNTGQTTADIVHHLPTAAAGYSFLATVGTAQTNHFGVQADTNDKIYLVAAAGTVAAGSDNAAVVMVAAQVGQSFACWTFKTDAYDWMCKAISIGTSTFDAHATGF